MSNDHEHTVQLAIYDLSRGMARGLTAQFLGPANAIELIPHTGIIVYGREYFYGGGDGPGISSTLPQTFRQMQNMQPLEIKTLGTTTKSRAEFEAWCQEQMTSTRKYTSSNYNLFENNCNNFSHDAALKGLKLNQGVPSYILEIPNKFLSSPFGQALQPALQQMQISSGGAGGIIPGSLGANEMGESITTSPSLGSTASGTASAFPPATTDKDYNPWASAKPKSTAATSNSSSEGSQQQGPLLTPYLDANIHRPMLSNDASMAMSVATKLVTNSDENNALFQAAQLLQDGSKSIPVPVLQEAQDALLCQLLDDTSNTTMALMLLRLLILHDDDAFSVTEHSLDLLADQLVAKPSNSTLLTSDAARAMAWCCLSNAQSLSTQQRTISDDLLEAGLSHLSPNSKSLAVPQAAASFLYNTVLSLTAGRQNETSDDELSDPIVSILCGALEDIAASEQDPITLHRRLLLVGVLLKTNKATCQLVKDLGLEASLKQLASSNTMNKDTSVLLKEIMTLLA